MALNHVSRLCRNVKDSIDFYTKLLEFVLMKRPQALDFDGAWLFNYGVDLEAMENKLKEVNVKYVNRTLKAEDRTTLMGQTFFNDPDGFSGGNMQLRESKTRFC
ncbi:nucleobase-ascorbate transporter 3 [Spatholobus suberectus]|nr:nucleobase-ascorbate transporter 3 [Spatholobus suberectus]